MKITDIEKMILSTTTPEERNTLDFWVKFGNTYATEEAHLKYVNGFTRSDKYEILPDVKYVATRFKMYYRCKQCGNKFLMTANNMQRGQDCPVEADVGRKYNRDNRLTFDDCLKECQTLYPDGEITMLPGQHYENNKASLKCKCGKCNKPFEISMVNLRLGKKCPYCNPGISQSLPSEGFLKVVRYIQSLNIKGLSLRFEVRIHNLKHKKHLAFDLAMCSSTGILAFVEYDGGFHDKSFYQRNADEQQLRDNIKNNYCQNENIKLIRINHSHSEQEMKELIVSFFRSIKEKSSTTRLVSFDDIKSYKDISSWEERNSLRNTNLLEK